MPTGDKDVPQFCLTCLIPCSAPTSFIVSIEAKYLDHQSSMLSSGSSSSTSSPPPPPPFFFFFFFSFSSSDCRGEGSKDREGEGSGEKETSLDVQRRRVKHLRKQIPPGWVGSLALFPFYSHGDGAARCPELQETVSESQDIPSCLSLSLMHFLGYSTRIIHGSNPLLAQESALHPPGGTTSPFGAGVWLCWPLPASQSQGTAGLRQAQKRFPICRSLPWHRGVLVPSDSHPEGQEKGHGGVGGGRRSSSITYHVHLHHRLGVLPPGEEGKRERESRLAAQCKHTRARGEVNAGVRCARLIRVSMEQC